MDVTSSLSHEEGLGTTDNEFKGGLSGASVGLVEFEDGSKAVYKSGPAEELEGEHRNYGEWARFNPDVVPKVYSAHHSGDSYSFLMEYIPSSPV
jgi:hypothetical protein